MKYKHKHKWVNAKDGTLDQICTKCKKRAKQAYMSMPIGAETRGDIKQPIMRKRMEVPLFIGDKTIRVDTYEDEIKKSIEKKLGLDVFSRLNY